MLFSFSDKYRLASKNRPVADAYIINYRDQDKSVSRANGIFDIWVLPGDSLIVSHISYYRKVTTVHSLLVNPILKIYADTINILEVDVSPNHKNDYERAAENLSFLGEMVVPKFTKIEANPEPTMALMTANNNVMRAEASSLTFTRFSPSEKIGKIVEKIKKRKQSRRYTKKRYSSKKKKISKKKLPE